VLVREQALYSAEMVGGGERGGIVGRERELATIARLLESPEQGLRALVIEGEPGIGKTTVWEGVFAQAAERGYQLLSCRPSEAVVWRLSFESCGPTAPSGCFFGRTPPKTTKAQALAALRKWAQKQKARVGTG
jgi:hypothetical protein